MLPNIQNRVEIKLSFGELKPILRWCEENCTGEWGYIQISPAGQGKGDYEFYFDEERDRVAFILWKT